MGEILGMSHETLRKVIAVCHAARKDRRVRLLVRQMDETGKVDGAFRAYRRLQKRGLVPTL